MIDRSHDLRGNTPRDTLQGKPAAQRAISQQLLGVLDDEATSRATVLYLEAIAQLRMDDPLTS